VRDRRTWRWRLARWHAAIERPFLRLTHIRYGMWLLVPLPWILGRVTDAMPDAMSGRILAAIILVGIAWTLLRPIVRPDIARWRQRRMIRALWSIDYSLREEVRSPIFRHLAHTDRVHLVLFTITRFLGRPILVTVAAVTLAHLLGMGDALTPGRTGAIIILSLLAAAIVATLVLVWTLRARSAFAWCAWLLAGTWRGWTEAETLEACDHPLPRIRHAAQQALQERLGRMPSDALGDLLADDRPLMADAAAEALARRAEPAN